MSMSINNIHLHHAAKLAHPTNEEQFVAIVKDTVGFNELAKGDKVAYIAGARMMFQKLAGYADLLIDMERSNAEQQRDNARDARQNLVTIADILHNARSES